MHEYPVQLFDVITRGPGEEDDDFISNTAYAQIQLKEPEFGMFCEKYYKDAFRHNFQLTRIDDGYDLFGRTYRVIMTGYLTQEQYEYWIACKLRGARL